MSNITTRLCSQWQSQKPLFYSTSINLHEDRSEAVPAKLGGTRWRRDVRRSHTLDNGQQHSTVVFSADRFYSGRILNWKLHVITKEAALEEIDFQSTFSKQNVSAKRPGKNLKKTQVKNLHCLFYYAAAALLKLIFTTNTSFFNATVELRGNDSWVALQPQSQHSMTVKFSILHISLEYTTLFCLP